LNINPFLGARAGRFRAWPPTSGGVPLGRSPTASNCRLIAAESPRRPIPPPCAQFAAQRFCGPPGIVDQASEPDKLLVESSCAIDRVTSELQRRFVRPRDALVLFVALGARPLSRSTSALPWGFELPESEPVFQGSCCFRFEDPSTVVSSSGGGTVVREVTSSSRKSKSATLVTKARSS